MENIIDFDSGQTGSNEYYSHPYGYIYTQSVQIFCTNKKAYWILDVIGSYVKVLNKYDFLILYFDVSGTKCSFYAKEDTDIPIILKQDIDFTDLQESVKFYFSDNVLMLPEDY